jgi:membrane-bound lytic murein transglycosylase F
MCLLAVAACEPIEQEYLQQSPPEELPDLPHPAVERDLVQILNTGVIRMVTRYNSSSYFIHKGAEAGFEYELFSRFALAHDLGIEVIIPGPEEDLISLLNSGRGDVIAAGMIRDERLSAYISFTRPYNFVHKVLILPSSDERPNTLDALNGLTVYLPYHSIYRPELLELRQRHNLQFFVAAARMLVEPEELITQVARRQIPATIVDDNLARAALTYQEGVRLGPLIGSQKPVAWAVRENSPELKAALNNYLKQHFWVTPDGQKRSRTYGILYERYYRDENQIRGFQEPEERVDMSGRISPYDDLIKAEAVKAGLDWRLVAALIYQESRFDPRAVSSAGAVGLMQVLPQFAGPGNDDLFDPATNLRAGIHLLKQTYAAYAYLDSLDRWRFTLATYHAGYGHMTDARRLAIDMGRDPNRWRGAVAVALPHLMQQRYFNEARHGFYRGAETVAYVQDILNRYRNYRRFSPSVNQPTPPPPAIDTTAVPPR